MNNIEKKKKKKKRGRRRNLYPEISGIRGCTVSSDPSPGAKCVHCAKTL